MGDELNFRLLSEKIQNLEKDVFGLQQRVEANCEQISSVGWEVRVRLSSAQEQIRYFECHVDPYSNDGTPIADSKEG